MQEMWVRFLLFVQYFPLITYDDTGFHDQDPVKLLKLVVKPNPCMHIYLSTLPVCMLLYALNDHLKDLQFHGDNYYALTYQTRIGVGRVVTSGVYRVKWLAYWPGMQDMWVQFPH